jgi:ABC-type bacteriocin/lantibiotic exporter with double-glycine peptidase domain
MVLKEYNPYAAEGERIEYVKQSTLWSCTAAVFQMAWEYVSGKRINHWKAIRMLNCTAENGADFHQVVRALRKHHPNVVAKFLRWNTPRSTLIKELKKGRIILIGDWWTFRPENHSMLLIGFTPKGFWVADPGTCLRWMSTATLLHDIDDFLVIGKRSPSRNTQKSGV